MKLSKGDLAELLRSVGALLLTAGAAAWVLRASEQDTMSAFTRLLILLATAVVLYGLALRERPPAASSSDIASPATSVLALLALALATATMFVFLSLVGVSSGHPLYQAAVLAVAGVLAAYTARRLRVAYAALLAGLALLFAWQLAWEGTLTHVSAAATRSLLMLAAVLLLAVAGRLARAGAIGARELFTAGGIAAVAAGVQGVITSTLGGLFGFGDNESHGPFHHPVSNPQNFGWNLYLLVVSALLLWFGARSRARGPAYVGGVGLVVFIIGVSVRITESGEASSGATLAGWPLALLLLGIAGLAAPRLLRGE
jgi:hypothetical protein